LPRFAWYGRRVRIAGALVLAGLALAAGGCKRQKPASAAQCERILDRYIDLRLSEDPAAARMTTEDRAHLRGKLALDVLAEPDAKQVRERCLTDVTEAEYDCARKAPTARAWNDCIE
jgi:hypothetical protein